LLMSRRCRGTLWQPYAWSPVLSVRS